MACMEEQMNRLYHRSQVSMEVTKVTLDAGDEDQILIQCWQGGNTYHTIYLYPQEGKKFEYIWDGQVLEQEYLVVVKGTKNEAEAREFVKHASTAESLALQAKYIPYGPMRSSSIDIIKKGEPYFNTGVDVLPHMPNTPKRLRRSVIADPFWWADNGAEVSERFGVWKGN